jgi:hypothetical protein
LAEEESHVIRLNPSGFLVLESCVDYEQVLALDTGKDKPSGGVLTWAGGKHMRCFFPTRKMAREAIARTEHYRKAFGSTTMPEAKNCHIEFVAAVEVTA